MLFCFTFEESKEEREQGRVIVFWSCRMFLPFLRERKSASKDHHLLLEGEQRRPEEV